RAPVRDVCALYRAQERCLRPRWSRYSHPGAPLYFCFFQAEDGIRDRNVTRVQTCALPISQHLVVSPLHRPHPHRQPRLRRRASTTQTHRVKRRSPVAWSRMDRPRSRSIRDPSPVPTPKGQNRTRLSSANQNSENLERPDVYPSFQISGLEPEGEYSTLRQTQQLS